MRCAVIAYFDQDAIIDDDNSTVVGGGGIIGLFVRLAELKVVQAAPNHLVVIVRSQVRMKKCIKLQIKLKRASAIRRFMCQGQTLDSPFVENGSSKDIYNTPIAVVQPEVFASSSYPGHILKIIVTLFFQSSKWKGWLFCSQSDQQWFPLDQTGSLGSQIHCGSHLRGATLGVDDLFGEGKIVSW